MPQITGTNPFEWDLIIVHEGTEYSVDGGNFKIMRRNLIHEMGDVQMPTLQTTIDLNSTTKTFQNADPIKLKVRGIGEANWLTRFTGIIMNIVIDSRQNSVDIVADGREMYSKGCHITHAEFGNVYVEEQEIGYTASSDGMYAQLCSSDAGPIQLPPKRIRVRGTKSINCTGNQPGSDLYVWNDGGVPGTEGRAGIPFYHDGGNLYGICLRLSKYSQCADDLVIQIQGITDCDNWTPDGSAILSAVLSFDQISTGVWKSWHYIKFPNQNTYLEAQPLVAVLKHVNGNALSTSGTPFFYVRSLMEAHQDWKCPGQQYDSALAGSHWSWVSKAFPFVVPVSDGAFIDLEINEDYTIKDYLGFYSMMLAENFKYSGFKKAIFPFSVRENTGKDFSLPLIRATYWKGVMDFSACLEDMIQDWGQNLYNVLDISVSSADVDFQGIIIHDRSLWDAMLAYRNFLKFAWRIWEDVSGTLTLEVRDKAEPSGWEVYHSTTDTFEYPYGNRCYYNGDFAAPTCDVTPRVALTNCKIERTLEHVCNTIITVDNQGNVYCQDDPSGLLTGVPVGAPIYVGGMAGGNMAGFAQLMLGELRDETTKGDAEITDVDMSVSQSIFVSCNELIYIKDTYANVNGAFAIDKITIDYGNGGVISIKIKDKVERRFVQWGLGVGIINRPGKGNELSGTIGFGGKIGDYDMRRSIAGEHDGIMTIDGQMLGLANATGDTWEFAIGDGTPGTSTLGNEIGMVAPEIQTLPGGGVILFACIDQAGRNADSYNDANVEISEIKFYKNGVPGYAYSIGTDRDGGGMQCPTPRLRMRSKYKKSFIFVKIPPA